MKTDSQLQQDVMAALKWDPSVHAAQIGVEVKDGVVTLAGEVSSFVEKWNTERVAQRVGGVKALAVELQVKLSQLGGRSDADIAGSVKNVLGWNSSLPADTIQVLVENGWVTLSGNVSWQYQRENASDSVRSLLGVAGVSNQISLRPAMSATLVKSDIEAALMRSAIADAQTIRVSVDGTTITLAGTVRSWAEREMASNCAWGTPGVRNVDDEMTLAN